MKAKTHIAGRLCALAVFAIILPVSSLIADVIIENQQGYYSLLNGDSITAIVNWIWPGYDYDYIDITRQGSWPSAFDSWSSSTAPDGSYCYFTGPKVTNNSGSTWVLYFDIDYSIPETTTQLCDVVAVYDGPINSDPIGAWKTNGTRSGSTISWQYPVSLTREEYSLFANPVPEPITTVLLGMAGATMFIGRRRH